MPVFAEKILSWPLRFVAILLVETIGLLSIESSRSFGRMLGRLGWVFLVTERRKTCQNLCHLDSAMGERTRARIGRRCFMQMGETVLESISLSKKSRDHLDTTPNNRPQNGGVSIQGFDVLHEKIENLRAAGKGVILVSAHIGSWELSSALIGRAYPNNSAFMAKKYKNQLQQDSIAAIRSRLGSQLVYQDESLLKSIRILQKGGVLSMLTDLDIHRMQGIFVPFFGQSAHTSVAPARLSLQTGAPVLFFYLIRDDHGYHVEIDEPIFPVSETEAGSELIEQITLVVNASIERAIRRNPSQWPWMHQRWHTTPEIVERRIRRRSIAG